MENYSFGNKEVEFKTNEIFLLVKLITKFDKIQEKINGTEFEIEEFKSLIQNNSLGLNELNIAINNANENNMWAELESYEESFANLNMKKLGERNPEMSKAFQILIQSDLFQKVKEINDKYTKEMNILFIKQTNMHKEQAENIIGKTNIKKITYMPFAPELFAIEPCYLYNNDLKEAFVQFTIPTNKEDFEKSFGMEYKYGIESVILFHEMLHSDIPPQSIEKFSNLMQRELDAHLKHTVIELLANGEMGVNIANCKNYFETTMHTGSIKDENENKLQYEKLPKYGVKQNALLFTRVDERMPDGSIQNYKKEDMGIAKIRGMMYPYTLIYKNRNNKNAIEVTLQDMQRDKEMIIKTYGYDFFNKINDVDFLKSISGKVQKYDSILEFTEGMSKELLGIEQIKEANMQDIEILCQEKKLDERASKCLTKAVQELSETFGKYITREEILERVKSNLNTILFQEPEIPKARGTYNGINITIKPDLDDEELSTVFFHEMVHCIRKDDEGAILIGRGIEEGFTQYVTEIRNLKYTGKEDGAYPILSEQIKNLSDLVGKEKFLNSGFMKQADIKENLEEVFDEFYIDFQNLSYNFDIIWKNEEEMVKNSRKHQSKEEKQFKTMFGDLTQKNPDVEEAKKEIINTFASILGKKGINTPEELNNMYITLKKYSNQLEKSLGDNETFELTQKYKELLKYGYSKEEISEVLEEDVKYIIKAELESEEFSLLNSNEKIEKLGLREGIVNTIYDLPSDNLIDLYREKVIKELYDGLLNIEEYQELYKDFTRRGIANYIMKKGYDFDSIEMEKTEVEDKILYKLLEVKEDKKEELSNLVFDMDELELKEEKDVNMYIDESKTEIIPSKNELIRGDLERKLEFYQSNIDRMIQRNAPPIIYARDKKILEEIKTKIANLDGKKEFDIQDVEKRAINNTTTAQRQEARQEDNNRINTMEQSNIKE